MAESVAQVRIRTVIEGLEGFDRVTGALKKLKDAVAPAEQQIDAARRSILAFGQENARSEQIIQGQIDSLKALSKEVALGGASYQELTGDIRSLEAELRGTTPALEQQRRALVQNVAANQDNAEALRRNIQQLERLRQQTRPGSSPYQQLGQDIDQARRRVTGITGDLQLFNLTLNQPPGASGQVLSRQIGILQRNMQGLKVSSDKYAESLERVNLLQTLQGQRGSRQQVIASAAMYASEQYRGFVEGPLQRFELPDTVAALRVRLGELSAELNNVTRGTERYLGVALQMSAVQRDASSSTQGLGQALAAQLNSGELARSEKNLQEAIGQLRAEMRELDTSTSEGNAGYAARASLVTQLEEDLNRLAGAYRSVGQAAQEAARAPSPYDTFDPASGPARNPATGQRRPGVLSAGEKQDVEVAVEALNVYDNAMADLENVLQSHRQTRLEIGEKFNRLELERLETANNAALQENQQRFEAELQQFETALRERDRVLQRSVAVKNQLGLGGRELSSLYQGIVNVGSARELGDAQRMGRSASRVFEDIVTTFNANSTAGSNVAKTLADEIDAGVGIVAKSAENLARRMVESVKKTLGIQSPSKVFIDIGQRIVDGLVKGIRDGKTAVSLELGNLFAGVQKASLPGQLGQTSDLGSKIAAFVARTSQKPALYRRYANLAGDALLDSPAPTLATYRRSYERGGIVPQMYTTPSTRRNLRGTPGIPGAGLEQAVLDAALKAVAKTGSLFGPIKAPINLSVKPTQLSSTFGTGTTSTLGGRVLPAFRASAMSGTSSTGNFSFGSSVPSLGSQFPMDSALSRSLSLGRGGASQSVKESIAGYRKAIDQFWDGEGKEFEAITKVVASRAQLSVSRAARRITESRQVAESVQKTQGGFLDFSRRASEITDAVAQTPFTEKVKQSARSLMQRLQGAVTGEINEIKQDLSDAFGQAKEDASRVAAGGRSMLARLWGGSGGGGGGATGGTGAAGALPALPDFGSFRNASLRQLQDVRNALDLFRQDLSPLDDDFERLERAATKSLRQVDRELGRRNPQGMQGKAGYIGQGIGAIASAGFFGGPEGALGGALGGGIGAKLGGAAGFASGAFIGSSIGAYASQLRQQIALLTDYAAQVKKQEIALKGVSGGTAQYERAMRAVAGVMRDFNVPQLEATQGMTKLTAAVVGAGGKVGDAELVFRNITAAIKATGGSAADVEGSLTALSQVFSKGKVSAEELQGQLGERLAGAVTMFAEATGRSLPQLSEDLQAGVVDLNDLMKFVVSLGDKYADAALKMGKSSADAGERLKTTFSEVRKQIGDALLPLGAELQDVFGQALREAVPSIIAGAKVIAGALKALLDNREVIANIASLALKLAALGGAMRFLGSEAGQKLTAAFGRAAAAFQAGGLKALFATGKVTALATAMKGLLRLGMITVAIEVVGNVAGKIFEVNELREQLAKLKKEQAGGTPDERAKKAMQGASRETIEDTIRRQREEAERLSKVVSEIEEKFAAVRYNPDSSIISNLDRTLRIVTGQTAFDMAGEKERLEIAKARLAEAQAFAKLNPADYQSELSTFQAREAGEEAAKQAKDLFKAREDSLKQLAELERNAVEEMMDLRKQTVKDIAKYEQELGDDRVKIEREIDAIRRKTAFETNQANLERRISDLASQGFLTAGVEAERDLNEIFYDYNEKKISREQQAQDDALARARKFEEFRATIAEAIAQIQEGVAKQAGEIQRAYAENVAEILGIGGTKAGNAMVEGAKQAAQILATAGTGSPGVAGPIPANAGSIATAIREALGLTNAQVAGVLGNLIRESGLNPRVNEGGLVGAATGVGGYGLAQWTGGRQQALRAFAGYDDSKMGDLTTQIQFLIKELQTTESRALEELRKAASPEQAALVFEKFYERSGIKALDERQANARKVFDRLGPESTFLPSGVTPADVGPLPAPKLPAAFDYKAMLAPVQRMMEELDGLFTKRNEVLSIDEYEDHINKIHAGLGRAMEPLKGVTGESRKNLETQREINDLISQGYTPELAEAKAGWERMVAAESAYLGSANERLRKEIEARQALLNSGKLSEKDAAEARLQQDGYRAIIESNNERINQQGTLLGQLQEEYRLTQEIVRQRELMQNNDIGGGFRQGIDDYVKSIGTMKEATAQLASNGIKGIEDAIFSLVTTGKANFREFAADILKQTARMIIQQMILRVVMQAIGAIGGGGGNLSNLNAPATINNPLGILESANGNAFGQNGIIPFAKGGIVNKPTLFKFAKGTGLMGEAGPEAIIPLKRGRDGKLGVAGGGGGNTTVNVSVDASGNSQVSGNAGQGEQLGRVVAQAVQAELIKQRRPGGLLAA